MTPSRLRISAISPVPVLRGITTTLSLGSGPGRHLPLQHGEAEDAGDRRATSRVRRPLRADEHAAAAAAERAAAAGEPRRLDGLARGPRAPDAAAATAVVGSVERESGGSSSCRAKHPPLFWYRRRSCRSADTQQAIVAKRRRAAAIAQAYAAKNRARRWCRRSRRNWTAPRRSSLRLACCGTRSIAVSTDGLSRLSVGGTMPSRMASTEKIASTAPAAPSRWPMADLVEDMDSLPAALPTSALDRLQLDLVAERRRGAVGVDVVDVGGANAGALERRRHAAVGAVAVLGRRGDVVGVARQAVADDLGIDLGAARLGVLVFLEHDDAGALAHDEAVAVLVVGARGARRARR